jgi:hypothetical protein
MRNTARRPAAKFAVADVSADRRYSCAAESADAEFTDTRIGIWRGYDS